MCCRPRRRAADPTDRRLRRRGGPLAIDLLEGRDRPEATWDYQRRAPNAEGMRALCEQCGQTWWDYPDMVQFLRDTCPAGINPLLGADENRELFHTRYVTRVIELILAGLGKLVPMS